MQLHLEVGEWCPKKWRKRAIRSLKTLIQAPQFHESQAPFASSSSKKGKPIQLCTKPTRAACTGCWRKRFPSALIQWRIPYWEEKPKQAICSRSRQHAQHTHVHPPPTHAPPPPAFGPGCEPSGASPPRHLRSGTAERPELVGSKPQGVMSGGRSERMARR